MRYAVAFRTRPGWTLITPKLPAHDLTPMGAVTAITRPEYNSVRQEPATFFIQIKMYSLLFQIDL